jgi:type I restriction enzyme R subunit
VGVRLDKIEKAIDKGLPVLAAKEIAKLRGQISGLPQASVVILDARTALNTLADENFWTALNHTKLEFLRTEIKPLFRTVSESDFKAMRFEKDVLEISLSILEGDKAKFSTQKDSLIELIGELPLSVHIVQREEELIRQAQSENYWATITDSALDTLVEKLSPLMKFRESNLGNPGPVNLNLQDRVHNKERVELAFRVIRKWSKR